MNIGRAKQGRTGGGTPRERIEESARELFSARGFHATTIAELATAASVSMGQIYRHFSSKDEIIIAIIEQEMVARVSAMHSIFDAAETDKCGMFDAVKALAKLSCHGSGDALFYEILAEAHRNPAIADRLRPLTAFYRDSVHRLAALARPEAAQAELEACADMMLACFIGLGYRATLPLDPDVDGLNNVTARIMMRAMGLSDNL